MRLAGAALVLGLACVSIATPAVAKCSRVSHFLETVHRSHNALVIRVKILEHSLLQWESAGRKFHLPVAVAEVLQVFRGQPPKSRITISGGLNGDDIGNIGPLTPGSEWILVGRASDTANLLLDLCSGNALKVSDRTVELDAQKLTFEQFRERLNAN